MVNNHIMKPAYYFCTPLQWICRHIEEGVRHHQGKVPDDFYIFYTHLDEGGIKCSCSIFFDLYFTNEADAMEAMHAVARVVWQYYWISKGRSV